MFKDISWLFVSDLISKAVHFSLAIILANSLLVSGFGIYSYIVAFVELFAVLYDIGLNLGVIKQVASERNRERVFVRKAILIKFFAAIICSGLILLISKLLGDNLEVRDALLIYLIGYIARSFNAFFQSLSVARQEIQQMAMIRVLDDILLILGIIAVYFYSPSLNNYLIYYAGEAYVIMIIWTAKTFIRFRKKPESESLSGIKLSNLLKFTFPFFLLSLFTNIYFKIDVTMINHLRDNIEVGYYTSGYRILTLLLSIPWVINRVFLPKIVKDKSKFIQSSFPIYFKMSLFFTIGICFLTSIYATQILILLFGAEFAEGGLPLSILVWSLPFCTVAAYFNNILVLKSPKKLAFIAGVILVPTNIILNIPLITYFSGTGAAIATVITEATGCIVGGLFCWKSDINLRVDLFKTLKLVLISLSVITIPALLIENVYAIFLLYTVYVILLYYIGDLKQVFKEMSMIRNQ